MSITCRKIAAVIAAVLTIVMVLPVLEFAGYGQSTVFAASKKNNKKAERTVSKKDKKKAKPAAGKRNNRKAKSADKKGKKKTAVNNKKAKDTANKKSNKKTKIKAGKVSKKDAAKSKKSKLNSDEDRTIVIDNDDKTVAGPMVDEADKAVPKSVEFDGTLKGEIGDWGVQGLYDKGNSIKVSFEGGRTATYFADSKTYKDSEGEEHTVEGFFLEDGDPADPLSFVDAEPVLDGLLNEGHNNITLIVNVPFMDESGQATAKNLKCNYDLIVLVERPKAIRFQSKEGFVLEGVIGYNYIDESAFYGKGNSFVMTVECKNFDEDPKGKTEEYDVTYSYVKTGEGDDEVEGFFRDGDPKKERLDMAQDFECYLEKKGEYDVELVYEAYVEDEEEFRKLPFTVKIAADKYYAYADWAIYPYTGKVIKPKFSVMNSLDEVVPAREYTFKQPKNKKIGWYYVDLLFKDEYKDKYTEDKINAMYVIGPKTPVLKSVKGGKKSLTVSWKKLSAAELKNADGLYIEIATDKNFFNNYDLIKVSGKTLKSGTKTLKKLKAGKQYHVRLFAYKSVKQDGTKSIVPSNTSKAKTAKTK